MFVNDKQNLERWHFLEYHIRKIEANILRLPSNNLGPNGSLYCYLKHLPVNYQQDNQPCKRKRSLHQGSKLNEIKGCIPN